MRIIDQYKPNNVLSTNVEAHGLVRWFIRSNITHMNNFQDDFLEVSSEQEITKISSTGDFTKNRIWRSTV